MEYQTRQAGSKRSWATSLSLSRSHRTSRPNTTCPTNNALLTNFRLSSDAEILSISTSRACKSAPNVRKRACNVYMFQPSFHFCIPPSVVGYHGTSKALCAACWSGSHLHLSSPLPLRLDLFRRVTHSVLEGGGGERRWLGRMLMSPLIQHPLPIHD